VVLAPQDRLKYFLAALVIPKPFFVDVLVLPPASLCILPSMLREFSDPFTMHPQVRLVLRQAIPVNWAGPSLHEFQ
jgi:hypothetical protein